MDAETAGDPTSRLLSPDRRARPVVECCLFPIPRVVRWGLRLQRLVSERAKLGWNTLALSPFAHGPDAWDVRAHCGPEVLVVARSEHPATTIHPLCQQLELRR